MIRRPPRSTPLYSSAASDVYKRQARHLAAHLRLAAGIGRIELELDRVVAARDHPDAVARDPVERVIAGVGQPAVGRSAGELEQGEQRRAAVGIEVLGLATVGDLSLIHI